MNNGFQTEATQDVRQELFRVWNELAMHIAHARAVIFFVAEAIPGGAYSPNTGDALNRACNLVGAVEDILELSERGVEELERLVKVV